MATQEDGLDISQLKDIILSSAPEVQADAVAELLQREKEQPNLRQKRQQSVSPIKPNELSDTVKPAQHDPSPIGASKPPNTSGHASHAPVRLTACQPEPPNTIADSTKTRMNHLGSQSQGDTQPISQWAVEAWTNNRTRELQSAARLSSNGISTGDNSTEKTYLPGQTGHVDLMAFVKDPSTLDDDGLSADGEVEDDPTTASQPQDIRAELFPESERFRPPKTPASQNKKRKRDADITPQEQSTPSLPINPFAGQSTGVEGLMDPSQLFKATQAPSSPFPALLHSDGLSTRPSPNLHDLHRPSTADAASSPVKLPRSSVTRSNTEPQTTYISMKESQEERERRLRALKEKEEQAMLDDSDDGFDSDDSVQRRRKRERQLEHSSKALFGAITAPLRPCTPSRGRGRGRGRGRRSGISHSEVNTRSVQRYSCTKGEPVLISDDPPPEAMSISSEDETEFEEDHTQADGSEPEDVFDEDKENFGRKSIQIPRTASKPKPKSGAAKEMFASPTSRRSRLPPGPKTVNLPGVASGPTDDVPSAAPSYDVADSQTSGKALPTGRPSLSSSTQAWVPASSPNSRYMVPQSQLPPGSRSSPIPKDGYAAPDDRSKVIGAISSLGSRPISSSASTEPSDPMDDDLPLSPEKADHGEQPLQGLPNDACVSAVRPPSYQELTTNEQSTHSASIHSEIPRSEAATVVEGGLADVIPPKAQSVTAASTIPESSAGNRSARSTGIVGTNISEAPEAASADTGNDRDDGVPVSTRSTVFESAQTHLNISPATPGKASKAVPKCQDQLSPIRQSSRLRSLAEIAAQPTPSDAIGSVDVDIDLMTAEDLEFHSIVSGSGPVAPARKLKRSIDGRRIRLTDQIASVTSSSPLSSPPDAPAMSRGHPSPTPVTENTDILEGPGKTVIPMDKSFGEHRTPRAPAKSAVSFPEVDRQALGRIQRKPIPGAQPKQSETDGGDDNTVQDGRRSSQRHLPKLRVISEPRSAPSAQREAPNTLAHPARVLALFTGNTAGYYPATCVGLIPGEEPRYKVRFDDDEVGIVPTYNVKRFELRKGDN
ncbi:MAG: hypothetical protein Q9198_006277, partial [Flavoplaca austrocitrina]